jgi:NAD(P)H-flavin reductase
MGSNPYRSIECEVLEVTTETPTIKTFKLRPKEKLTFLPGQFMEMSVPGVGEAPFTPSSFCGVEDTMEFTIVAVGKVTDRIHGLEPGDTAGLRGPYGHGYPLENFRGKDVYVVGGGVGLAPIRTLMYSLFDMRSDLRKLVYRAGCREPREFLFRDEIADWASRDDLDLRLTVDNSDGRWTDNVGVVTTIMDDAGVDVRNTVGVACGPPIMMKFVTLKFLEMGVPEENIYLSMEKNMSCGFGKCGHCRLGTFYCCKDGPVFTYAAIKEFPGIWE